MGSNALPAPVGACTVRAMIGRVRGSVSSLRSTSTLAAALLTAACLLGASGRGYAQVQATPVEPDFKATIGLGLVGAELGFVLPAVAGLHDTWAFVVFPVLGAAGGGAVGYFLVEKGTDSPELSVAMLATGMALIIPAMIVTLSATAYDPEEDMIEQARAAPPALLRVTGRGVALGAPALGFAPQERQLRVSLLSGRL